MKVTFKGKEFEINEPDFKERLELTGLGAGTLGGDGSIVHGIGFATYLVRVFELSGLKDSDFEGFSEGEYINFITEIRNSWFPDEKK